MQDLSEWIRPHLHPVALAMVATVLVVFGSELNRWVRKSVRKYNFFVRLLIFVLVCGAGYGTATVLLTKLLADILGSISNHYLALVVALIFVGLGLAAEERNQM